MYILGQPQLPSRFSATRHIKISVYHNLYSNGGHTHSLYIKLIMTIESKINYFNSLFSNLIKL